MPLNLLPFCKEKTKFKTLAFGLKSRFHALKSICNIVTIHHAYLFFLPLTLCITVLQQYCSFTSPRMRSFPPRGLCTCYFQGSLHDQLLLILRPPPFFLSSSQRGATTLRYPHNFSVLVPGFLHDISRNLQLFDVFVGLPGLEFVYLVCCFSHKFQMKMKMQSPLYPHAPQLLVDS